jgi:hypothetical protein
MARQAGAARRLTVSIRSRADDVRRFDSVNDLDWTFREDGSGTLPLPERSVRFASYFVAIRMPDTSSSQPATRNSQPARMRFVLSMIKPAAIHDFTPPSPSITTT